MRKALVVGIDYYKNVGKLYGCVNDAYSVKSVLERNADGTINFGVKLLTGTGENDAVPRQQLKQSIKDLFAGKSDIALLYFAGHGYIDTVGGYIISSDNETGDDGISLSEILVLANDSAAKNKIIILDSCHSGYAGAKSASSQKIVELSDGLTILTASTSEQYAKEENGNGIFTKLLVDALNGAAGNLVGDVTPGGVYAHIDQSLGPWDQRPVFRTNVQSFVSLRKVYPSISLEELQKIATLFPVPGYEYKLSPAFEPEGPCPEPEKTEIFETLQRYNRVNLLIPVDAPHMYHAAMESKSCRLTVLGEHYRSLVERKRI